MIDFGRRIVVTKKPYTKFTFSIQYRKVNASSLEMRYSFDRGGYKVLGYRSFFTTFFSDFAFTYSLTKVATGFFTKEISVSKKNGTTDLSFGGSYQKHKYTNYGNKAKVSLSCRQIFLNTTVIGKGKRADISISFSLKKKRMSLFLKDGNLTKLSFPSKRDFGFSASYSSINKEYFKIRMNLNSIVSTKEITMTTSGEATSLSSMSIPFFILSFEPADTAATFVGPEINIRIQGLRSANTLFQHGIQFKYKQRENLSAIQSGNVAFSTDNIVLYSIASGLIKFTYTRVIVDMERYDNNSFQLDLRVSSRKLAHYGDLITVGADVANFKMINSHFPIWAVFPELIGTEDGLCSGLSLVQHFEVNSKASVFRLQGITSDSIVSILNSMIRKVYLEKLRSLSFVMPEVEIDRFVNDFSLPVYPKLDTNDRKFISNFQINTLFLPIEWDTLAYSGNSLSDSDLKVEGLVWMPSSAFLVFLDERAITVGFSPIISIIGEPGYATANTKIVDDALYSFILFETSVGDNQIQRDTNAIEYISNQITVMDDGILNLDGIISGSTFSFIAYSLTQPLVKYAFDFNFNLLESVGHITHDFEFSISDGRVDLEGFLSNRFPFSLIPVVSPNSMQSIEINLKVQI